MDYLEDLEVANAVLRDMTWEKMDRMLGVKPRGTQVRDKDGVHYGEGLTGDE